MLKRSSGAVLLLITLALFYCQAALAHGFITRSTPAPYIQPQIVTLGANDRIVILGDSVSARGDIPGGCISLWRQYCQTTYPQYNFQISIAGYPYLSSTALNYPGKGIELWNEQVVAAQPTVLFIWLGIDNILVNHGVDGSGPWDMAAYGQDLQTIIDAAHKIPSVRQIVLVTPLMAGERWYGYNPQDAQLDNVIRVIQQTSINNKIPVLNMRAMAISAEYMYNRGNYPKGVFTGDGVHPYTDPAKYPGDKVVFYSQAMEQMIMGEFVKGCGM